MIEIITNSSLDQISYIDSNGNPVTIIDQKLIETCKMMKRLLGVNDIFDESLINEYNEPVYEYIVEKTYTSPEYDYGPLNFKEGPKQKMKIAFNKLFYKKIKLSSTKEILINYIKNLNILNSNSEITILGGEYASILIPAFQFVKRITLIDIDKNVITVAKNRLFNQYKNVDCINSDIFDKERYDRIRDANLIINTCCEHMKPMKELYLDISNDRISRGKIPRIPKGHFAFQSNKEFKEQLPEGANVLIEDTVSDERGTRFMLIGKL